MDRISRLQESLEEADGLIVEDPIDLYYLTGVELSKGRLILTPHERSFFVDGRYYEMCQKESLFVDLQLWDFSAPFPKSFPSYSLGFDATKTSFTSYQKLQEFAPSLIPLQAPVEKLRRIKETQEIEKLTAAAALCREGYHHLLSLLNEGISEEELSLELEIFWKKRGGKKLSFDPIIAFGAHSSLPHYRAGSKRLAPHDTILLDMGVMKDHYHSDMTRTLFWGKPEKKMQDIYNVVLEAQEAVLALCREGVFIRELSELARKIIMKSGFEMIHGLGHGVGLEVHEAPSLRASDVILESSMVITVEPGIYLPQVGGVRIEDTIVITKKGYENLTALPKNLQVIGR